MLNLRQHTIEAKAAFQFQLAADARSSRTEYSDDQAWTVTLGQRDETALALKTQYGGRADLVSIEPSWRNAEQRIQKAFAYHQPPRIRHFAPNFLQIEAMPLPDVQLIARFWAMESRAVGGEFTLSNHSAADIALGLDLFCTVKINGRKRRLNVLTLADYTLALHLGEIDKLNPVLTLEGAGVESYGGRINSPKLGCRFTLAGGGKQRIPFVVAGLEDMRDSFSVAQNWMSRPWGAYFKRIDSDAAAVPKITTGNESWDRVIELSYAHLLQAFMGATEQLPYKSFVANRASNRGWSRRGDGSDHMRAWAGQDPTLAYLALPAVASIDGALAQGVIRNYLAIQEESGFIDRQPGLAGQRQGLLMMPLLARLSWLVYQQTEDTDFLAEVLPPLWKFFQHWLSRDYDADGDGAPEWRSERQLGYVALPTFGRSQIWAQGADIRLMESPDLLAYLISEADALGAIAAVSGEEETRKEATAQRERLLAVLDEFWDGSRFHYRDRDTHETAGGQRLLHGGAGDQEHQLDCDLPQPARVMIRVVGGVSQVPRITLFIDGADASGSAIRLSADAAEFNWLNRQGIYISERVFSRLDRVAVSGLSRVYKVYAQTIDSSQLDINALLPLWTGRLSAERAAALAKLARDEAHFLRPNGITMVSASERGFDPSNARGGGGIWMYWLSLVGEGLVKAGYQRQAAALVKRVLTGLARVLEREGRLSQFYHADEAKGFGEKHHIGGSAPLHLLNEVIGIRILSPRRVYIGRDFGWGEAIAVEQHGIRVERDASGTAVTFPSGHQESLPAAAPSQVLEDPDPLPMAAAETLLPPAPELESAAREERVLIEVEDSAGEAPEPETAPADDEADEPQAP